MADGNYRHYLQTNEVKIKKYFYVLRPILACMWIENFRESPPMEFEKLLVQIADNELSEKIAELLEKKKSGIELGIGPRMEIINNFIENKLQYFQKAANTFDPGKKPKQELLEEGFIKILESLS